MHNVKYRRMEITDIPAVVKLRILQLKEEGAQEDFDITNSLAVYYLNHINDKTFVGWVAVNHDIIIGTSGMSFCHKPPYYANPSGKIGILSCMYTIEEFRRKGVGKNLLEKVVDEAREYGCGTVYITASKQGALLYQNAGFHRNENFFQLNL